MGKTATTGKVLTNTKHAGSNTAVGDLLSKSALALSLVAAACVCFADMVSLADLPYAEFRTLLELCGVAVAGALLYGIIFWFCFFHCKNSSAAARVYRASRRRNIFISEILVSAHGSRAPPL